MLNLPKYNKAVVLVVDNDVNETARTIVDTVTNNFSIPIYYFVEPKRGISTSRNCLVNEALKINCDFIGFIDDDEFPEKNWLINHWKAILKFNADVVTGPVISVDNVKSSFSIKPKTKFKTGYTPRHVAAGNVLFKNTLVTEQKLRFDKIYNFTGGEDFHFFDRSKTKGNHHIWVDDAIIFEQIMPERKTKKYLFFRHFTGAINNVIQYKQKKGEILAWIHFTLKILGKTIGSAISFVIYIFTLNKSKLEKTIIKLASAIGYISGLLNIIVERYR